MLLYNLRKTRGALHSIALISDTTARLHEYISDVEYKAVSGVAFTLRWGSAPRVHTKNVCTLPRFIRLDIPVK